MISFENDYNKGAHPKVMQVGRRPMQSSLRPCFMVTRVW